MTTKTTQSVEDILRPLAERTVVCPECKGTGERDVLGQGTRRNPSDTTTAIYCPPTVPDPRFAALRCVFSSLPVDGQGAREAYETTWRIDASLGAIVRAAAACNLSPRLFPEEGKWGAILDDWYPSANEHEAQGATPEEALARALVVAVGDENSPSGIRSDQGKA